MFNDEELRLIGEILMNLKWKTGQSRLAFTAEQIISKINDKLKEKGKKTKDADKSK